MRTTLLLAVVGADRTSLVESLAQKIAAALDDVRRPTLASCEDLEPSPFLFRAHRLVATLAAVRDRDIIQNAFNVPATTRVAGFLAGTALNSFAHVN
jgi:hypothetical protein